MLADLAGSSACDILGGESRGRPADDRLLRAYCQLGNCNACRHQHGISVAQIYRAGNNPLLDRMITRFRGDKGELIPKGRVAARRAIAALRRGTHLTLLADQKMNDGIPVPFFGRPAMTAPALAVLALRFDCDVLPARVERLDGAHFRLTVFPPLLVTRSGDFHADAAALMTRVNATLEEWIRDRPEQWLWVHRRWPD